MRNSTCKQELTASQVFRVEGESGFLDEEGIRLRHRRSSHIVLLISGPEDEAIPAQLKNTALYTSQPQYSQESRILLP